MADSEKKKYAPRFKREPSKQGFRLRDRDREIFRHLYRTRIMSISQLTGLVKTPGTKDISTERRLRDLFHEGYIDRVRQYPDSDIFLYAQGNKGAQVVAEELDDPKIARLDWEKKNRELRPPFQHQLMIAEAYATFELACRESGEIEVAFWTEGEKLKVVLFTDENKQLVKASRHGGKDTKHVVWPDAFFALRRTDAESGDKQEMYLFLEADRSTETGVSTDPKKRDFLDKLKDYWRWNRVGGHTSRWGIQYFLVLTVTKSPERRDNLTAVAKTADDQKIGSPVFRFACEKDFTLEKPRQIFGPIWKTPVDNELKTLLG